MAIKVLIAEDHQILVDGLKSMLGKADEIDVVGSAQNGNDVIDMVRELKPDVVLMDISLPGMNGVDVTRIINRDFNNVKVLALSMHAEKKFILEMLKAGACGYMLKDTAFDEIVRAIKTVYESNNYLSPSITDVVIQGALDDGEKETTVYDALSGRERQVLQLLSEGRTTKQAAADLHISPKTVETHRAKIMDKLKLDNLAELTKYALKEGLTSLK